MRTLRSIAIWGLFVGVTVGVFVIAVTCSLVSFLWDFRQRRIACVFPRLSVLFYPEGTRSPDGEVRPFKHGAFRLAVDAGVDVLPVLVTGAADLLPKNSFHFSAKKAPMRMVVGDPIPVAGLGTQDVPALA